MSGCLVLQACPMESVDTVHPLRWTHWVLNTVYPVECGCSASSRSLVDPVDSIDLLDILDSVDPLRVDPVDSFMQWICTGYSGSSDHAFKTRHPLMCGCSIRWIHWIHINGSSGWIHCIHWIHMDPLDTPAKFLWIHWNLEARGITSWIYWIHLKMLFSLILLPLFL